MIQAPLALALIAALRMGPGVAHAEDAALDPYETRLDDLVGAIDQADDDEKTDPRAAHAARAAAMAGLTELDLELRALVTTADVAPLRAKVLLEMGTVACAHGDLLAGNRDLLAAEGMDANPERDARIARVLDGCRPPLLPPVETPEPTERYDDAPEEEVPREPAQRRSYSEPTEEEEAPRHRSSHARPLPGSAAGGLVLGILGGAAIAGTYYVYRTTPQMTSDEWTSLKVGNAVGWLVVGVGGILVVAGEAHHGLAVHPAFYLVPGV